MFSYKAILNDNKNINELSDDDIKKLQRCMLTCTNEILEVCNRHNIKLILQGGTLLGHVRHNGFIPWDDDMDFGLLRSDYEKFISLFNAELSDRYYISVPKKGYPSYNRFIQLFRKGTVFDDGQLENDERPLCISIDIFPLDYAPNNRFIRIWKGIRANIIMAIGGCVDTYKHMNSKLKNIMCSSFKGTTIYALRMIIGKIFSWRSPKIWFELVDKAVRYGKRTDYITSATGRKHYLNEIIPAESVLPLKKVYFEGLEIYSPKNPDIYLKNLYGDYMTIPSEEKRERHFAVKIETLE